MKQTPREAQEWRIQRILAEPTKAALLADEPGVGKTLVGVEVALRGGFKRVLIVGIRDTCVQWAERLSEQSDGAVQLRRIDSTKPGKKALADFLAGEDGFFFSGSEMLTKQDWEHRPVLDAEGEPRYVIDKLTGESTEKVLTERFHRKIYSKMRPLDLFIFDECQKIQSKTSITRRSIVSIKTEWKIAISGTPNGNSFSGAWSIGRWVFPDHVDTSSVRWAAEYCSMETVYLPQGKTAEKVIGERVPGRFYNGLPCYIRAEAEDRTPEPRIVTVPLYPEQQVIYDSLVEDGMAWLESHYPGLEPMVAALPITKRIRLRQAALGTMSFDADGEIQFSVETISTKLMALRQVIDGWGDQPVIIGTESKRFAKVVVARMKRAGYGAVEWSGDVSSKSRAHILERFTAKDTEYRYIVSVIPSLSTGFDGLQRVCNKAVVLSLSEDNIQNTQWIARLFRPGRTLENGGFEWVHIHAEETLDLGIFVRKNAQSVGSRATLKAA